jgi:SAM-dependent methyltransferase
MVDNRWFDELPSSHEQYLWLQNIPTKIDKIINFGCWHGDEPFKLLWTLDSSEIQIIEIDQMNVNNFKKLNKHLDTRIPESISNRNSTILCTDISNKNLKIKDNYYDLAFCKDVLYNLYNNQNKLLQTIENMVTAVKPNGYIIVIEPKYGVDHQLIESFLPEIKIPIPISQPKSMKSLFSNFQLKINEDIHDAPDYSYIYQKMGGTNEI